MLPHVLPVILTVIQGIIVVVPSQTSTELSCFSLMVSICLETSCGLHIYSVIYICLLNEEGIRPLRITPLLLCVKGYTSSTPTHNSSGLGAATPISPSVITLLVKACWCVSLPLQQQHSCVWYSVGGIQCSVYSVFSP